MARITADDCSKYYDSRYEMVLIAADRARQLELGESDPQIEPENDKPTVIALREMAAGIDVTAPVKVVEEVEEAEVEDIQALVDGAEGLNLDQDQLISDIETLLGGDEVQDFSDLSTGAAGAGDVDILDELVASEEDAAAKKHIIQEDAKDALGSAAIDEGSAADKDDAAGADDTDSAEKDK